VVGVENIFRIFLAEMSCSSKIGRNCWTKPYNPRRVHRLEETVRARNEQGGQGALSLPLSGQIKLILAMGGGVFASIKKLKATYAILQSVARDLFPLEWDVLFFSMHSRSFQNQLQSLILETGEIKEALWGRSVEPFHHIYFLTQRARKSLGKVPEQVQKKPFFSDFLLWSLLPTNFCMYWSYLLELRTYHELRENKKKELPYLPLLENEPDKELRKGLEKQVRQLCQTLPKWNIGGLELGGLSHDENNNLYIFLPFKFGPSERKRFLAFYNDYRHNKYVRVFKTRQNNTLRVQVDPGGIRAIYNYAHLSEFDIGIALERFDIGVQDYEGLVEYYSSELYQRISKLESCQAAYYFIQERAKKREALYTSVSKEVKQEVIDKGKTFLNILRDCYGLAEWRFNDIMKTLKKLATLSQRQAISLLCEPINMQGYLNNVPVRDHTLIGFEFSKKLLAAYSKEFGHGLPSGELQHIHHFVQPIEALKAIYNDKEQALLWGGPVIGEY